MMTSRISGFIYGALFIAVFALDRFTKHLALTRITDYIEYNRLLSFDLIFNRGVSWGWFHSSSNLVFGFVSFAIFALVVALAFYTAIRWMNHSIIIGEIMVLAGAISNLIDRVVHHGVIDFILVTFSGFRSPVFNIADICIVCGVLIMFVAGYDEA